MAIQEPAFRNKLADNRRQGLILLILIGFFVLSTWLNQNKLTSFYTNLFGEEIIPEVTPLKTPELSIERVDLSQKEIKVGEEVQIYLKITNQSEVAAQKVEVKVFDSSGWGYSQKTAISPNLYKYLTFTLKAAEAHRGDHQFTIILDPTNQIPESNKEDNKSEFSLKVN